MTGYSQPAPYEPQRAEKMSVQDKATADEMKRVYLQYVRATDSRSQQTTIGPSELGTVCDRRLAMKLVGVPTVGEGGDGWAAWVGTQCHEGLAKAFEYDNEQLSAPRWLVEQEVTTGHPLVPRGTADLYDRRDKQVNDHKIVGDYLLNKIKQEGLPGDYRIQLQMYGLAMEHMGYQVERVALVAWPKARPDLKPLYVKSEEFDEAVARGALSRLSRIIADADSLLGSPLERAMAIPANLLGCKFCPYKTLDPSKGCPGDLETP